MGDPVADVVANITDEYIAHAGRYPASGRPEYSFRVSSGHRAISWGFSIFHSGNLSGLSADLARIRTR